MFYTTKGKLVQPDTSFLIGNEMLMGLISEAALPFATSHDALRGHLRDALRSAHGITGDSWSADGPWVSDVFPSHVVYQHQGKTMKRSYTVTDGAAGAAPTIKLGNPKAVHVAYVDSKAEEGKTPVIITEGVTKVRESIDFEGIQVKEGASPLTIPICIIKPGWGSSAYYSEEVLKESGPKAFPKGTLMNVNHPTDAEEAERPEGDYNNLGGVSVADAYWDANGAKGPGLYARAKVFSDYATQVQEKGPYTGLSINAGIRAVAGEAEGRKGLLAKEFVPSPFNTIDFVARAGAGGAPIVPAREGARSTQQEEGLTDQEKQELETLRAQLAESKLKEAKALEAQRALETAQNQVVAVGTVSRILREAEIPFNPAVLSRACQNPKMTTEGKIDREWLDAVVADFSDGHEGRVTESGRAAEAGKGKDKDGKDDIATLKESYQILGLSEAGAEIAAHAGGR